VTDTVLTPADSKIQSHVAADIVADLTSSSALLIPITEEGEEFLTASHGVSHALGATFCKRSTAEQLIAMAKRRGVAVRVESDSASAGATPRYVRPQG
jgi:hypothetical protein